MWVVCASITLCTHTLVGGEWKTENGSCPPSLLPALIAAAWHPLARRTEPTTIERDVTGRRAIGERDRLIRVLVTLVQHRFAAERAALLLSISDWALILVRPGRCPLRSGCSVLCR